MFCTNCGREIIDTARFCNFCGTPIQNMAMSIPVQPVQPVQPAQSQPVYSQPVQPVPDFSESTSIPATENISENAAEEITESTGDVIETEKSETTDLTEAPAENTVENTEEITANDVPTPNTIPTYGASEPIYPAPPAYPTAAQSMTIPVQSAVLTPESKPERKYTLGHIMMCLAAVAIMAIVAGVFAGLYFSVV